MPTNTEKNLCQRKKTAAAELSLCGSRCPKKAAQETETQVTLFPYRLAQVWVPIMPSIARPWVVW